VALPDVEKNENMCNHFYRQYQNVTDIQTNRTAKTILCSAYYACWFATE